MTDICILHNKNDEKQIEELSNELSILGVRTDIQQIEINRHLKEIIKKNLKNYPAIVIFISSTLAHDIKTKKIKIKINRLQGMAICFKVSTKLIEDIEDYIDNLVVSKKRTIKGCALEIVGELMNEKRKISLCPIDNFEDFWKSPLYLYRKIVGLNKIKEIIINMTWSAIPTRAEPAPALENVLRKVFQYMSKRNATFKILDFGAGKLRHTDLLLKANHKVTAVEYPQLFLHPSEQIQNFLDFVENHDKFGGLFAPSDFISSKKNSYDLILLINVLNIIPELLDRLFILELCNKKLDKNKYLLWFTQYGDEDQRKSTCESLTDGGCTTAKSRRTFYTEFDFTTINLIMGISGFKRINENYESGHNQAWLYKKTKNAILDIQRIAGDLRASKERKVHVDKNGRYNAVVADVLDAENYIKIGDILSHAITNIPPGRKVAYLYEDIIKITIEYIFSNHFVSATMYEQYQILKGRHRIDLKTEWRKGSGFKSMVSDYIVRSSWVPIEFKNYSGPLRNPEYGQIVLRCHQTHRHFGMIICRDIGDDERLIQNLHGIYEAQNYLIIVLDDKDLKALLYLSDKKKSIPLPWIKAKNSVSGLNNFDDDNDDEIVKYINSRVEEIINLTPRRTAEDLINN